MKINFLIVLVVFFSSLLCCDTEKVINQPFKDEFKIVKIDSIENVYIYYVNSQSINKGFNFRILSKKESNTCKEKIQIAKIYKANLIDLIIPNSSPKRQKGIIFNHSIIYLEDSIASNKLYTSKNFKGKCYIK